MSRSKKSFSKVKGYYYFDIFTHDVPIMIHRADKEEAIYTFERYQKHTNKRCAWHGMWDGKKFVQTNLEKMKPKA
ncbi:MAG: hypothetical protein GY810_09975 [Aureispira sp.]|nr:hypothetical protein [Aureispira sp.]